MDKIAFPWRRASAGHPRRKKNTLAALCLAVLCAAHTAAYADYTGTVLYPLAIPSDLMNVSPADTPQTAALGQIVGSGYDNSNVATALLWTGPTGAFTTLTPTNLPGFTESSAYGTNGSQQVGSGAGPATGGNPHALLWSGSANTALDLNPLGYISSQAYATNGLQQVGNGLPSGASGAHALLWSSTPVAPVDLHPASFISSSAVAISGSQQAGSGLMNITMGNLSYQVYHALLWSGTAASVVDLNPAGYYQTLAAGLGGNQQVGNGEATSDAPSHALLWTGTANSLVDLNPTGFIGTFAVATNGSQQLGYGYGLATGGDSHALLWSGTAASAVDLQPLLPASGTWFDSTPYSFDASGNVFGTADGIFNGVRGTFAVEWSLPSATNAVWNGTIGNWSDASRWSTNPVAPNNGTPSGAAYNVTISAGAVTLDINAKISALFLSGGKLDLSNHRLIVEATDAADKTTKIAQLNIAISAGSSGGTWTGNGLTSSTAAANASHLGVGLFDNGILGLTGFGGTANADANSILLAVAHLGDANGNGIVDIQDLTIIANNWQQARNNWAQGDLNRDGIVDIQDFTIVANNWQQSFSGLALAPGDSPIPSPAPEPASLGLLLMSASAILMRRRRSL